jgi:hypothetical protein
VRLRKPKEIQRLRKHHRERAGAASGPVDPIDGIAASKLVLDDRAQRFTQVRGRLHTFDDLAGLALVLCLISCSGASETKRENDMLLPDAYAWEYR